MIEIKITADPTLIAALTAFSENLNMAALAIDSSLRIRQHEINTAETGKKVADKLREVIATPVIATEEAEAETDTAAPTVTMEDVRAELARLNKAGKKEITKGLLTKYNAERLSDIKPDDFAALYAEAKLA